MKTHDALVALEDIRNFANGVIILLVQCTSIPIKKFCDSIYQTEKLFKITYSNYNLFWSVKYLLGGVRYPNNKWLKYVVEAWLEGQT